MKSFDADTPLARKYLSMESDMDEETRKKVNENMLGLEILSVEHYPEATLKNVRWKPTGKTSKRNLPESKMSFGSTGIFGSFQHHD